MCQKYIMEEKWQQAEELLEKIKNGEVQVSDMQRRKLESLIEGHKAQVEADIELKKGMIGLLYEKFIYSSKISLLEKLGVRNKWRHPLLAEMREVLFEENELFEITDFMGSQE